MSKVVKVLTRQQIDLREAFKSAESVTEMLKLFQKMDTCFPESELGTECYVLAHSIYTQGDSPDQALSFGKRALSIFIRNNDNHIPPCVGGYLKLWINDNTSGNSDCNHTRNLSFYIACLCNLLAAASIDLKRYQEGLSYLNWADRNFTTLLGQDEDSRCVSKCVLHSLLATHSNLITAKIAMGITGETIVVHAKKVLEIREKTEEEGSIGIGNANRMIADAYFSLKNFEESLPFYLEALDVFTKCVGDGSVEEGIGHVRKNLRTIYVELGEHDKALEQARLSLNGVAAEMEVANLLLELGRNEEAIEAFSSLLPRPEIEGYHQIRARSFMGMARGYCNLGKFADAKKYMEMTTRILEKKNMSPDVVATAFDDMSRVYETMKDYESAFFHLGRVLAIPQRPQENPLDRYERLFSLIALTGNYEKGIPYLEESLKRLKKKFGKEHSHVGYGYGGLGLFYKELGKHEIAAECFARAKDVYDVSLGPYHLESLKTSQTLSMMYAEMDSYNQAIVNQEKVVRGYKVLGPSEQENFNGAVILLKELKELATSGGPEIFPATSSKSGIPEVEGNQEARVVSLMGEDKILSAKKCIEMAQKILDKNDISPLVRATAFEDMSEVYEVMTDYGSAISYLHRALVIPELPHDHRMDSFSRLISLISISGEEKKGISCLEEAVERLKDRFGPNHVEVGYGYKYLGTAYMNSDETESAVKYLAYAKTILDISLGPHHFQSLETSQMLSINYADMGRFDQALEIQEKVIEGSKGLGQSEKEFQDEAVSLLNKLKEICMDEVAEYSQGHA